jgi:hypothetical protein
MMTLFLVIFGFVQCYPQNLFGSKLVASDVGNLVFQGSATCLSANGLTLAVGAFGDNANRGAVFVYTRTGLNSAWSSSTKLVGTGFTGAAPTPVYQGCSCSFSADGNTLAFGGYADNSFRGSVWVYARTCQPFWPYTCTWSQQAQLFGTGFTAPADPVPYFIHQGTSVALSGDGSTLAFGGPGDNNRLGATWVFIKTCPGGICTWSQQGNKIVGSGYTSTSPHTTSASGSYAVSQGQAVSLSYDGNTLAVGGNNDMVTYANRGSVWIYTRSCQTFWPYTCTWTQQGNKFAGWYNTPANPSSGVNQGYTLSLSSDGNTLAFGGYTDNSNKGGVWTSTRGPSGCTTACSWSSPVTVKLTGGSNPIGEYVNQGCSVSMSADGLTIAFGALNDNYSRGSVYVYTRTSLSATFVQQRKFLLPASAQGTTVFHGYSVSLSADGNTLVAGGPGDNAYTGAVWTYV